jgi:hypothetical protein
MRKDRKRRRVQVRPAPSAEPLSQIHHMAKQLMAQVPPDEARKLEGLLETVGDMAAYEAMGDEIDAAMQVLESHRAEFEALVEDEKATLEQTTRLFSEERFEPMRYTAAEIDRAFEAVGYPSRFRDESEEWTETFVAAALYLADDMDYRFRLARQLLMMLPEYVNAGRYLDASLIQYSAYRMIEFPDEINPFLFEMFDHGFREWARGVDEQQRAMLGTLGVDDPSQFGHMSADEADAWLEAKMADPEVRASLEAYYKTHPTMRKQAEAEFVDLERNALELLDRDDADCLHLSSDEVADWMPALVERMTSLEAQARQAEERGEWPDPDILQAVQVAFMETAVEMIPTVFTPERLPQLKADLKNYRRDLEELGEQEAATHAHMALILLGRDGELADNRLLTALGMASLQRAMVDRVEEARAKAQEGKS